VNDADAMVEDHTKMRRGAFGTFSVSRVRLARGERRVPIIKASTYSAQGSTSTSAARSTDAMFARTFARIHGDAPPWTCEALERAVVAFAMKAVSSGDRGWHAAGADAYRRLVENGKSGCSTGW